MTEPERIWRHDMDRSPIKLQHGDDMHCDYCTEYFRADVVDALRKELDEATAQGAHNLDLRDDLGKRFEELKAKLATARRDALEEAAQVAESYIEDLGYNEDCQPSQSELGHMIRALIDPPNPVHPEHKQ